MIHRGQLTVAFVILLTLLFAPVLEIFSVRPMPAAAANGDSPNIIIIQYDDMRSTDWAALPNTRTLLSDGTWYENYYVTTPLCCPSRASLLTGLYSHNHRVLQNSGRNGGYKAFKRVHGNTLAVWLNNRGYRTALIGKYLNGYKGNSNKPPGWDYTAITTELAYYNFTLNENGKPKQYKKKANNNKKKKRKKRNQGRNNPYVTDVLRDKSIKFIQSTPDTEPIFMVVGMRAPHAPATPAKRHRGAYKGSRAAKTPAFNRKGVGKVGFVKNLKKLKGREVKALNKLERQRKQTLKAADAMFVSIWQTLEAEGRLGNGDRDTYIFVISDNGMMMGEHRLKTKGVVYDHSVRIPMIAWSSNGDFQQGLGTPNNSLVGNIDIAPTIVELIGMEPNVIEGLQLDGLSLLSGHQRDAILLESLASKDRGFLAVRTNEYLYIVYLNGYRELYDKIADPYELTNIINQGVPDDVRDHFEALKNCRGASCTIPPLP